MRWHASNRVNKIKNSFRANSGRWTYEMITHCEQYLVKLANHLMSYPDYSRGASVRFKLGAHRSRRRSWHRPSALVKCIVHWTRITPHYVRQVVGFFARLYLVKSRVTSYATCAAKGRPVPGDRTPRQLTYLGLGYRRIRRRIDWHCQRERERDR